MLAVKRINKTSFFHSLLLNLLLLLFSISLTFLPIYVKSKNLKILLWGSAIAASFTTIILSSWIKSKAPYLEVEEDNYRDDFLHTYAVLQSMQETTREQYANYIPVNNENLQESLPQSLEPRQPLLNPPKQLEMPDNSNIPKDLESSALQPILGAGMVKLIGYQGSGKTTLAAALIRHRLKQGHKVVCFNHHYEYGSYKPLKVYGVGGSLQKQFDDIAEGLIWFVKEKEDRYVERQDRKSVV